MIRACGLVLLVVAGALLVVACGGSDSSLENLGNEVQATNVARSTATAIVQATNVALTPVQSVVPSATPAPGTPHFSGDLDVEVNNMSQYATDVNSFFAFLNVRLASSGSGPGALGDAQGNLTGGWLETCCANQLDRVRQSITDANAKLNDLENAYTQDAAADHLALIPGIRNLLVDAEAAVNAVDGAATLDEATFIVASGTGTTGHLLDALDELAACCNRPATPTPVS